GHEHVPGGADAGRVQRAVVRAGARREERRHVDHHVADDLDLAAGAARAALKRPVPARRPQLYGDGRAAQRVVAAMARLAAR
ncbi:MAG: hypothetical protein QOJ63_1261, partial [Solirubrobacteraceae bacterium]|nr:hypothetical protein [Solirubrobacteraceae bacterium]